MGDLGRYEANYISFTYINARNVVGPTWVRGSGVSRSFAPMPRHLFGVHPASMRQPSGAYLNLVMLGVAVPIGHRYRIPRTRPLRHQWEQKEEVHDDDRRHCTTCARPVHKRVAALLITPGSLVYLVVN